MKREIKASPNEPLKSYARERRVTLREIADELNVSERTINRWLLKDLDQERSTNLYGAINRVFRNRNIKLEREMIVSSSTQPL